MKSVSPRLENDNQLCFYIVKATLLIEQVLDEDDFDYYKGRRMLVEHKKTADSILTASDEEEFESDDDD